MRLFNYTNSKQSSGFSVNQMIVLARKLYNKIPSRLRWVAFPMIFFYRFCRLIPKLRLKLWILTGDERNSQMPLSILYADSESTAQPNINKNFMLDLIFGESYQKVYLGRAWMWNIQKVISENGQDCSLMVVHVHDFLRKLLKSKNWFYIPLWLGGEVDIPIAPKVIKKETLRSDLRKILKNSLQFEVTRDPQKFDDFYHNMYLPHVTKTHGNSAYIVPYEEKRIKFRNCDLLLVKKEEKSIAGILISYEKGGSRLWSLGIRDGNLEYVKEGAVTALFNFSFLFLEERGFNKVKLGLSRAFLNDGVLKYKKKWSQKIAGTSRNWFALKVLSYQGAAGVFLQKNPFIFEKNGILHGAVFVDADKPLSPKILRRIGKQHLHSGLAKLFIYRIGHSDGVEQESIPSEFSERIVFSDLVNS